MKKDIFLKNRVFVLFGIVGITAFVLAVLFLNLWGGVKQPLAFNHQIHAENDVECIDCHPYFKDHASSGKPMLKTCMACHEEPQGESKAEMILMEYIKSGEEIEWERLYRVPEDVYFSHRRHVVIGEMECLSCHGDIGKSLKPPAKPIKITMKRCMKCHEEREASIDCIACHR